MTHTMDEVFSSNTDDRPLQTHSIQQVSFLAALSEDIILEIFAYVGQEDYLTTMAVCRSWYYSIPQLAPWTTLRISPRHIGNQRLYNCLGEHVKYVAFEEFKDEQELHAIMHKLLECGCTKIKSIEWNGCTTAADQEVFVRVLQKLSSHVTHLKMLRHNSNVAFLHVLNACPQLTHFVYQANQAFNGAHYPEPSIDVDIAIRDQFPTITHMYLDTVRHRELVLDPILRRCPNLRCFVGANLRRRKRFYNIPYDTLSVNFDLLFQWCPKIAYIENTFGYTFAPDIDDIVFGNTSGLQHLSVCQVYQPETVLRHLKDSQHTLNLLSIRRHGRNSDGIDWFSVLQSIRLSKLQTLVLGQLGLNAESIAVIINNCPTLGKLVLCDEIIFNQLAIRNLEPTTHLHTLILREVSLAGDVSFMSFLNKFPALEKLAIYYSTIPLKLLEGYQSPRKLKELDLRRIMWIRDDDDISIEEAVMRWFQCFAIHSRLEIITLSEVPSFDLQSLPSIASIPTLKSLTIQVNEAQCTESEEDGLRQFASLLETTVIEELYMETWWHIPEHVLGRLRVLPRLNTHHVSHRITTLPCSYCSIPRKNISV